MTALKKIKSLIKKIISTKEREGNKNERNVRIGNNSHLYGTIAERNITIGNNCNLFNCEIGEYTYLSMSVSAMNTVIGKYCSIAQGVGINLGMHPTHTFVSTSPMFFSVYNQCGTSFSDKSYFKELGNCNIGNDVWIGANVIIKDNIKIADGAIIGAGAIVTKDVPAYAIVVGNPAKILRYRFNDNEIEFLLKFKWWDKDASWLKDNLLDMHNINTFILKHNHK